MSVYYIKVTAKVVLLELLESKENPPRTTSLKEGRLEHVSPNCTHCLLRAALSPCELSLC